MTLRVACCRYFAAEVRAALAAEGLGDVEVVPFQGPCDNRPRSACAPPDLKPGTLVVAGDCAALPGHAAGFDTCFCLLLGRETVHQRLADGLHLMTPAMVEAWRENARAWGFAPEDARQFFSESIRGFRVVDAGVAPIRPGELAGLADYTGLPVDVEPCTLDHLRRWLRKALHPRSAEAGPPAGSPERQSDYAMSLDLIQTLLQRRSEADIIQGILEVFAMLCAPEQVAIQLKNAEGPSSGWHLFREGPVPETWTDALQEEAGELGEAGFHLALQHSGATLARILVMGLQFPAWRDHYLNLASHLAPVLALVLVHHRQQRELAEARLEAERAQRLAERLEAEVALAASEARNQTMLRTSLDGMGLLDARLRFLEINDAACRMLGYERAHLLALRFPDLAPAGTSEALEAMIEGVRSQESGLFETQILTRSSRVLAVEASMTYLADLDQYVLSLRDIGPRKQAEELQQKLEDEMHRTQQLESLGTLAGGISHDLNNVLAVIQASTQTLQRRASLGPEQASLLGTVDAAVARGRDLLKNLASLSRKDLRHSERVDLNELAREAAETMRGGLPRGVEVHLELEDPLPSVLGEWGSLTKLLQDVCANGIEALITGGRLTLRTRQLPNERVELSVRDSGVGMAPEVLAHAMDPFFTTKPVGKGRGLGLAMAYATAKAHKGQLTLESEPGRGTLVRLQLPASPQPLAFTAPVEALEHGQMEGWRILLVDDDHLVRTTIPEMLGLLGHHVSAVAGGQEALDRVASGEAYDLLLLDLNMPGLNGLETLARLRVDHPNLAVLLATGYLDPTTTALLAQDGRAWGITKPYTLEEIEATFTEIQNRLCG